MANGICSRCGHRHHHHSSRSSSRTRSESPKSVSIPHHLAPVLQSTHSSLLGLDPNFLRNPRFQGAVYNVGVARNYTGTDSGDVAVLKWVRGSHSHTCRRSDHLQATLRTVIKAAEVIYAFLEDTDARGWRILINYPRLVVCDNDGKYGGIKALVEPYISGFERFNSNSGWARPSHRTYSKMLQALSHFSYVWSGGRFLLCDLQGGVNEEDRVVVLSDPAIVTEEGGIFGCSDIGKKGIRNFFHHHECNKYCEHLTTPKDRKLFFRAVQSTITTG